MSKIQRKPKILCLHGFRTSGAILKKQIEKWPAFVLHQFHFHFIDAPFPSKGKSDVQGIYDPPYFEWFQFSKDTTGYENFESCLEFIENHMLNHGPFDGLLGFSQGAALTAALPGLQAKVIKHRRPAVDLHVNLFFEFSETKLNRLQGVALRKVPKIKFVIIISGSKLGSPSLAAEKAYFPSIACPSLHFLSEEDFLMPSGLKLLEIIC
ncbi:dihydrofolate reductase-like isoform X1 [Benincasa hispida]|uniref:dihydrofolate reductase-like isoform X1 n=1 Tax=Benincasa hispida TaxID=102211 RepID=UPI001902A8F6|nr:dihydrofolate reductase-like isoform X1 [Benincasa hispida]